MTEESPKTRTYRGWSAPLMSTLVTLPLALFATALVAFSPMSCDSCDEAEHDRFQEDFEIAWPVYLFGLALTIGMLLADYVATWQRREAARLWLAFLAPITAVLNYLIFAGVLDGPWV
ncbi:hypothetical protein [Streptomyces sp. ME19-01-6]|uniref:hypothetical protein n=1 Tax=Streptomyces sp. ME19-01-6 TaxID=3028686 RepID=UPI0029B1062F|nr:hypothetical protein [Streptomyces sp. ME19-01-6]MDX3233782.1 hypothetical protein [Streptomyces sp. ME19-01-6]